MLYFIISISIVISLLIIFLIILFILYYNFFYSPLKGQNDEYLLTERTKKLCDVNVINSMLDRILAIPYEDAYISSYDKKKLHAYIYKGKTDTVCLMLHGYRGTARRDFSGGAYEMISRGHTVVLIDHRGHGESQGHSITFGVKEREDAKSWIKYIKDNFGDGKRIVLIGISMGGATSLFASDLLTEKDRIIADCPYVSSREMIKLFIKMNMPKLNINFAYGITNLSMMIYGHANLNKENVYKHINNCPCPILIIHGNSDTLIPYQVSYELKEKYPDKITYLLIDGAEHGLNYMKDTTKYNQAVDEFLK